MMIFCRREFLASAGTMTVMGLAGCSESSSSESETTTKVNPEEISYPFGHEQSGVTDVDAAFGEDSPLLQTSSVEIVLDVTQERQDDPSTEQDESKPQSFSVSLQTNQEQKRTHVIQESQKRTVEQYLGDGTMYIKSGSGESVSYRKTEKEYVDRAEYIVQVLTQTLKDVEFDSVQLEEETLVYALNSSEGVGEENPIQANAQGSLSQVNYEYQVSKKGLPEVVDTTYIMGYENMKVNRVVSYNNYNNVKVSEPDWLGEAKKQAESASSGNNTQQQPITADVSWEETNSGVDVTLNSLSNGDSALIFIRGTQFSAIGVEETVSVPSEEYTGSDGQISPIAIAAQNQDGGYVLVDQYQPSE
ncbi:hypothetical protein [Haloferax profundi]|uniref:hypothetical protein n=1 Tax=Haloferax profundi TaxID=1544718 RepID=UPI0018D1FBF4|nr:hypothetical protein [Haloferax profundi]